MTQNKTSRCHVLSLPCVYLTICLKTLDPLGRLNVLSGTQRSVNPSAEFARARCILAIMAFSSFCKQRTPAGWMLWQTRFSMAGDKPLYCLCEIQQQCEVLKRTLGCVCVWPHTDPLLAAAQHQKGFNVMFLQVSVPLASESWLHLVVPIQILQCGFGDVDTPTHTYNHSMCQKLDALWEPESVH